MISQDATTPRKRVNSTAVAGVIAASLNGSHVVGVAPQANLWVLRICAGVSCPYSAVYEALQWLSVKSVQVINFSIADCADGSDPPGGVKYYLDQQLDNGVFVVVSAGNGVDAITTPPGGCPNAPVSKFAAWDSRLTVVSAFSSVTGSYEPNYQYGPEVDIAGPTRVTTDSLASGLRTSFGGTSAATPHVAGALALSLAAGFSPFTAFSRITQTAVNPNAPGGRDNVYGWGMMRMQDAAYPKPQVSNVTWCNGSGSVTSPGDCEFRAFAAWGLNPPFQYKFEVTRSDQPGNTVVYGWGSSVRNIAIGAGDYTLTVTVTVYESAYTRLGGYQIRDVPVCTGNALQSGSSGAGTQATGGCGGGGGGDEF